MAVDYGEVLKDMDTREATLTIELNQLKAARPVILAFKKQQDMNEILSQPRGRFVGVGATKAIPDLLKGRGLMTLEEVIDGLRREGWTTKSTDAANVVSSTLAQLKDTVERLGERYRLKPAPAPVAFADRVIISHPADNSLAAQDANGSLLLARR